MRKCPRIVIAAAHSGSGKTSLAISLTGALCRRGYNVQTFKVGPDFLDPTYLALVSGKPCYNLDSWMMDKQHIQNLFDRVTRDADIAVIEGVMGLFDGADPATSAGSTAQIADWLDAPILLIVNSQGHEPQLCRTGQRIHIFRTGTEFYRCRCQSLRIAKSRKMAFRLSCGSRPATR